MNNNQFVEHMHQLFNDCTEILKTKGIEYTQGDEDRLKNFKVLASELDMSPLQVWGVYFRKHIDAIMTFVKKGRTMSDETIRGRFMDAINYLFLGWALIEDEGMAQEPFVPKGIKAVIPDRATAPDKKTEKMVKRFIDKALGGEIISLEHAIYSLLKEGHSFNDLIVEYKRGDAIDARHRYYVKSIKEDRILRTVTSLVALT